MLIMEERLTIPIPLTGGFVDFENTSISLETFSDKNEVRTDTDYEQFLADLWVGIVLTLMVLSCVCCMCSCLLYHKFQQWKRHLIESRNAANLESANIENELPSYTIASGLPTYQEALEQLQKLKESSSSTLPSSSTTTTTTTVAKMRDNNDDNWVPRTPPTPVNTLSVTNLFQMYNKNNQFPVDNK